MSRLILLCLGVSSCAATSGREWLSSPIDERPEPSVASVMETEVAAAPRPRLSRTVTLGESYAASSRPLVAARDTHAPVQVNVHMQVPVIVNNRGGYGYYGYGHGYGYGYPVLSGARSHVTRSTSSMPTKVGGDFPAPPDHGPRAFK